MSSAGQSAPVVSVLMPVFNGEDFVRGAVESILRQTFRDFRLIIVDDGSTDATPAILRSFTDSRVRVLRNPRNMGIVAALNRGLTECRGEFIARMDHDDVAMPQRLEKQVAFLRSHPQCAAVSCWFTSGPGDEPAGTTRWPTDDLGIRWRMLFHTALAHAAFCVRADAMREAGAYTEEFPHAEDYDLACRLARVGRLGNVPEVLLHVRTRAGGVTMARRPEQQHSRRRVSAREIGRLMGTGSVALRLQALAESVLVHGQLPDGRELAEALAFSLRLAHLFEQVHDCPGFLSDELEWILKEHAKLGWLALLRGNVGQVALRGWTALQFAGSGLVRRPLRLVAHAALARVRPASARSNGCDPTTGP